MSATITAISTAAVGHSLAAYLLNRLLSIAPWHVA